MEDEQILNLYFSRSEQAIGETASKYGPYCHSIAMHVLENEEDAEECVSDTYMTVWQSIPTQRPVRFPAFLAAITRSHGIDMLRARRAAKRGGGEYTLASTGLLSGYRPYPHLMLSNKTAFTYIDTLFRDMLREKGEIPYNFFRARIAGAAHSAFFSAFPA